MKAGFFALALVALGAVSCGPKSADPPSRPARQAGGDQYLILAAELDGINRDNLYDAVHQLRPGWFTRISRSRSGEQSILVYLNDRQIGDVTVLRRFSTGSIESVRYLSPTEAQVRYGQSNLGRPAIQLELRR